MGGEVIAEGQVRISTDTAAAEAGLKKLESDFQRQMDAMGRAHAEAKLSVDKTNVDKEIDEAKVKLDEFKKAKAEATLDVDKAQAEKDIAEVEAELEALGKKKTKLKFDTSELKDANRLTALGEKRQAAMASQYIKTEAAQKKLTAARAKESEQVLRNNSDLSRLRETYAKTLGDMQNIEKKTGRPGGIFHTDSEKRHLESLRNDLALTAHKIEGLGGAVDDIDPDLERHQNLLGKWGSSLSHLRIQMGFFSATLRQMAIGMIAVGPILTSLVGSAASVIGVLGTGMAGAAAVGAAGLGGFALSAVGVGLVLKPVIGDIKAATAASKSYHEAVLKYGKGSEQAKSAQEKLNMTLKGISPAAREAIKGLGAMEDQWTKLTAPARKNVFDAFGASIKTAKTLLPSFAKESDATTKTLSDGWDKWMKGLRSGDAQQAIKSLMGNFRQSIPGVMDGLESIGRTISHISVSASKMLPGLSKGFAEWGKNLMGSVGSGAALDAKIQRLVGHMQDLGHLAQASGRLLANFFNISADSGDNLTKSLTGVFNKWTEWMKTAEGKESLKNFFSESADETKNLFSALGSLTKLLFNLGRATAPLSNGMLTIVKAIGDVVNAASSLPGVGTALKVVGGALAGLIVVNKVRAFASAIGDAAGALRGLFAAEGVGGGLQALFGLGGAAGGATAGLGRFEGELGGVATAEAGVTEESGLMAAAMAPEVIVPAAGIGALALLVATIGKVENAWEKAHKAFVEGKSAIPDAMKGVERSTNDLIGTQKHQESTTKDLVDAEKNYVKVMSENAPVKKRVAALNELHTAQKNQAKAGIEVGEANHTEVKSAERVLKVAKEHVKVAEEEIKVQKTAMGGEGKGGLGNDPKRQAEAERDLAAAHHQVAEAEREMTVAQIPLNRAAKELQPISEQTQVALEKLSKTIGAATARKIGNFVNPQDVKQVTDLSSRLDKLGRGDEVKNVDVKSHGADETISKLQKLQNQTQHVEGHVTKLTVGTNDTAAKSSLQKLGALSQKVTGSKQTIHILANSSSADQAIQRLQQHLHKVATDKYEATMSAHDVASPVAALAYHHAREFASKKYEAEIKMIDKASPAAQKAEGSAKKASGGHYEAHITANTSAANAAIGFVTGQLAALNGTVATTKIVTIHETVNKTTGGHGYAGGPFVPYAAGGKMTDAEIQKAAARATWQPNGPSRKVSKPTMLVGEQPGHPEYVIATNPSYRAANERYLEQAAQHLGYNMIPAYKQGKGKKEPATGPKAPFRHQSKPHYTMKKRKFLTEPGANSVGELNATEQQIQNVEGNFNAELSREEQEIAHKKRAAYDFGTLRGYLNEEAGKEAHILSDLIPSIRKASNSAITKAVGLLKGPLSATKVKDAQRDANGIAAEISHLSSPTKQKGESTHDYDAKKNTYKRRKNKMEKEKKAAEKYAKRLASERAAALQIKTEATEQLNEIRQETVAEHHTKAKEIETEQTNYEEIEANPEFAPYYEAPNGGASAPTPGEETASLNEARFNLYNEAASNIGGYGGPQAGSASPYASPSAKAFSSYGATGPSAAASTNAASTGASSAGTVNNVTNHFAAPPPDPHTWTKNTEFELGALAG